MEKTDAGVNHYETGLDRNAANFTPLTPLTLIERAAAVYPDRTAVVHGAIARNWRETFARCRRLADALRRRGIGRGDTVAVIAPNVPAIFEAHFGVPMAGAVLNAINYRLDARSIAFILNHSGAKILIADREFGPVVRSALEQLDSPPLVVDLADEATGGLPALGALDYEAFLAEGDARAAWEKPDDEWNAIALNYTSGTTGDPKGVVYHHRGAFLSAVSSTLVWGMTDAPIYLWTLPMFHCNGWCFPWTLAALAGTSICLRRIEARTIFAAIAEKGVTHLCGAPIVMNMLINAKPQEQRAFAQPVQMLTAAAPPPAAVIARMEEMNFRVTHVYGLTETYGPAVVSAWKREWDMLPADERARLKSRQGVRYPMLDGLMVADPQTLAPVPADGNTMGEVFFRGNMVMKGYFKNPAATERAFAGGWFHSGDLGVLHPDGYIELRDRSKDIIISGGENISSIEVESALYRHPAVLEAAVVARPDEKWGEHPCAFVTLKDGASATADDIAAFCRENMAHFKVPKTVVFGPLPKTSTGKVQKFVLRARAKELGD